MKEGSGPAVDGGLSTMPSSCRALIAYSSVRSSGTNFSVSGASAGAVAGTARFHGFR